MPRISVHISQNVEEDAPCFIGRGDGFGVLSPPHFIKCGGISAAGGVGVGLTV